MQIQHLVITQWYHNGQDGFSNHQVHDYLLNCLFRRSSQKTSKRVTGHCEGKSHVAGELRVQRANNAENVLIGWRHRENKHFVAAAIGYNRSRLWRGYLKIIYSDFSPPKHIWTRECCIYIWQMILCYGSSCVLFFISTEIATGPCSPISPLLTLWFVTNSYARYHKCKFWLKLNHHVYKKWANNSLCNSRNCLAKFRDRLEFWCLMMSKQFLLTLYNQRPSRRIW